MRTSRQTWEPCSVQGGHDAHSVLDEDLRGAADPSIAKVCQDERRILITLDLDFAHIKNYPPKEIRVRLSLDPAGGAVVSARG